MGVCERCGSDPGEARYCATCGADQRPEDPRLRTEESLEAGSREERWLAGHPDVAAEVFAVEQAAARDPLADRSRAEQERLATLRPETLGGFRDLRWRELVARALLVSAIGLSVLSALFEAMHIGVVSDPNVSLETYTGSDGRLTFIYLALLVAYLLSAAAFIVWLFRARRNVDALGARHLRFGPGWAIGGWFVPILGLWRPKQVVNEVWRASDPGISARAGSAEWGGVALPPLLAWWWGAFLAAGFLDRISVRIYNGATTLAAEETSMWFSLLASLLTIVAGVLAIVVLRRLSARQHMRKEALEQLPEEPVAPPAEPVPA